MSKWFWCRDGQEQGPYDDAQLKKLAAEGILSPTDVVRRDDAAVGTPAKSIKGLFTSRSGSTTTAVRQPPPPGSRIGAPAPAATSEPRPSAPEWHYAQNNVQHGPVSFSHLRDLASSGRLQPTDLVWKMGTPNWQVAGTVDGLFSSPQDKRPPLPGQVPPSLPLAQSEASTQKRPWHKSWKFRAFWATCCLVFVLFNGVRGCMQAGSEGPSSEAFVGERDLGELLVFKRGELYYTPLISTADARRLGEFLVEQGYFDDVPKTVQITKNRSVFELRMVVKAGVENDQQIRNATQILAKVISNRVFGGAPVHVHLCDDELETLRVVFSDD